ncbi:hypothetical protein PCE1_003871 [Barthelona sp. PCE]
MNFYQAIRAKKDDLNSEYFQKFKTHGKKHKMLTSVAKSISKKQKSEAQRKEFTKNGRSIRMIQRWIMRRNARKLVEQKRAQHALEERKVMFDEMATKIQSAFRGYFVRRFTCNWKERREYINAVKAKNEEMKKILDEYRAAQEHEHSEARRSEEARKVMEFAEKKHHLVSTKSQRGVYTGFVTNNGANIDRLLNETNQKIISQKASKYIQEQRRQFRKKKKMDKRLETLDATLPQAQGPFPKPSKLLHYKKNVGISTSLRNSVPYELVEKEAKLDRITRKKAFKHGEFAYKKPNEPKPVRYIGLEERYEPQMTTFIKPQPQKWISKRGFTNNAGKTDTFDGKPAL